MIELRAAGARYPMLVKGLQKALKPLNELLYERFERLKLKEVPFQRGETVSTADSDDFFDTIKPLLANSEQSLKRGDIKRAHLS